MVPVLTASRVSKRFGPITAVDDVSVSVGQGEIFALLGPNGAGKTTLIRMIVGLIKPDEGTITRAIADARGALGYLPEERGLYGAGAGREQRMSEWPARMQVARWEFLRFMKPNQLAISFVLMLLVGALGYGVSRLAKSSGAKPNNIAVIGGSALGLDRPLTVDVLAFLPAAPAKLDSLRGALIARQLDGILILTGADSARLS